MTAAARRPDAEPHLGAGRCLSMSDVAPRPMPVWVRGALVKRANADAKASIPVFWLRHGAGVPDGCILLSWYPTSDEATTVTARLGLTDSEVTLAMWPSLRGDWSRIVHPTLHEVLDLYAAMSLAKDALRLANALLDSR